MTATRTPPHDLAAERACLGAAILDADCARAMLAALSDEDFYADRHAALCGAMRALARQAQPIDSVTVRGALAGAGALERAGGDEYLLALTDTIPMLDHVTGYCTRVRDLAGRRAVIAACHRIAAEGYGPVEDEGDFLARAERALLDATTARARGAEPVHVSVATDEAIARLVAQQSGKISDGAPVPSGLRVLDWMLAGGFWPGTVTVIAGRPGSGKSSLGWDAARSAGAISPSLVFSLEMAREELGRRQLSEASGVDGSEIRAGKLSSEQMRSIMEAGDRAASLGIWIDDTPGATVQDVRRKAVQQKRKHGLSLVVVDYLQLMRAVRDSGSREQDVAAISRTLKEISKELAVPVVALCQLNRDCEKGADKRPQLAHLRESGAIEQDADCVIAVYRDEMYDSESEHKGTAELLVLKQRGGKTGTVKVAFRAETTTFHNLEQWRE